MARWSFTRSGRQFGDRLLEQRHQVVQRALAREGPRLLTCELVVRPPERGHLVAVGRLLAPGHVDRRIAAALAGEVQAPDRVVAEELMEPGAAGLSHPPDGGRHDLEGGVHLAELVPRGPRHRFLSLDRAWRS